MWNVFYILVAGTFHTAFHWRRDSVSKGCTLTCIWEPESEMRNKTPDQTITPRQVNQPKRGRARQNTMKMSQAAEKLSPFQARGAAFVSLTAARHERSSLAKNKYVAQNC